ncbi:phage portal protein [Anaeromyxobacter sp. PSR-1]|uniref:phage portal protein n=1 Tax=Anaeromyxobacter sp. PSR-1 TaxID=1300915 RepID=UPI0005E45F60|nr:phage portal protein [Anaeromyxobacter sp. PSR-1]GAO01955.1 portal protein [Anaeromyxobacter sp. PSR-1]
MANFWRRILGRARTEETATWTPIGGPFQFLIPNVGVPADLRLSPIEQLRVGAAWACIWAIANDLASQPWRVVRVDSFGRETPVADHRLDSVLNRRPNPLSIAHSVKTSLVVQAAMHGNGYAELARSDLGVAELWPLRSDLVTPRLEDGVLAFEYRLGVDTIRFAGSEVIQVRAPLSIDGLFGESPLAAASRAVAASVAAERFGMAYFSNGAQPNLAITMGRPFKDEDEREGFLRRLHRANGGLANSFKSITMPPGSSIEVLSSNAEQAQLVEVQRANVEAVLRYFGVPGHRVGVAAASQGWGKNLAEMNTNYVRSTLTPWARSIEQELDVKLFGGEGPLSIRINLNPLTKGDDESQARATTMYVGGPVKTVNEGRAELGLEPLPGEEHDTIGGPAAAPPRPLEPGEEEAGAGDGEAQPTSPTAQAAQVFYAAALRRHATKLGNRERDLRAKHQNGVLADKLELARQELRSQAMADMHQADGLAVVLCRSVRDLDAVYGAAVVAAETSDPNVIAVSLVEELGTEASA